MYFSIIPWSNENSLWRSSKIIDTYFSQFDGKYFTGDGCRREKDDIIGLMEELMT